jgi:hypothetical protein
MLRAMSRTWSLLLVACLVLPAGAVQARTVYRCVRDGTVSLSTAPEPGSRCEKKTFADDSAKVPNLWGSLGVVNGTLYERVQDGKTVYGTRKLPGATKVLAFTVETPPGEPAHAGLGQVGKPRIDRFATQFKAAAKKTGVDDAYLRAIAHAESGFDANAVSPKGAVGVMQLMPGTARDYGVADPTSPEQSIDGAARMIRQLAARYRGDMRLVAAAYNAGAGVVSRYGGVPPYRETQQYIAKVEALYARYRSALGQAPKPFDGKAVLRAAQ